MKFIVVDDIPQTGINVAYLIKDNWDDWDKYQTQFSLHIYDKDEELHFIGAVKIGQAHLRPGSRRDKLAIDQRSPKLPANFDKLNNSFFSVGQNENYYETLISLPDQNIAKTILLNLNDCAYNLNLFDKFIKEDVMHESLLRDIQESTVRDRFFRLAHGDAKLTSFDFEYFFPLEDKDTPSTSMEFHIVPGSMPPTNTHVIIGRNGVGKTRFIKYFITSIANHQNTDDPFQSTGEIKPVRSNLLFSDNKPLPFSSVVSLSFSAFDKHFIPDFSKSKIRYNHIGLTNREPNLNNPITSTETTFSEQFHDSLQHCSNGLRKKRWLKAVQTLETDPLFQEHNVSTLIDLSKDDCLNFFSKLSSGHKIILLSITRLVELVDEKTLVLIDEPESHLHPPLLSAFIRTLSELLTQRNGIAIIATHSPVILQEIPRTCVWKLRRSGRTTITERPAIETFGENVSLLTHHIFGLEVTHSGFHKLLSEVVENENYNYQNVLAHFSGQLGFEAKMIVQGLIAAKTGREVSQC